jgi:hypothetical protein
VVDHSTSSSSGLSLVQHFLPKNYPHSVSSCYANFSSWQAVQMVVSSASGVLTMQSLLFAIGVGAGSVPMAAALNWILKDGIGQLGAIIFGSWAGNRFDSDPKRFRMLGCVAQDTSHFLEALTPLAPHLFLPLASLANGCKNITWFAASSTRAAINKSMCLSENLADVTGKAVSQSIASSLAGTALGIGLSTALTQWAPVVGSSAPNPLAVLAALVPLAGLHWYCCYKSLGTDVLMLPNTIVCRLNFFSLQPKSVSTHSTCSDSNDSPCRTLNLPIDPRIPSPLSRWPTSRSSCSPAAIDRCWRHNFDCARDSTNCLSTTLNWTLHCSNAAPRGITGSMSSKFCPTETSPWFVDFQ